MAASYRPVLLRVLFIAAVGLIPALLFFSFGHITPEKFTRSALEGLIYAACIGGISWLVLPRLAAFVLRLPRTRKWAVLISAIILIAAAGCFAASLLILGMGMEKRIYFWEDFIGNLKVSIFLTLIFGLGGFAHEVTAARLNLATEALERERRMAMEARLSSLESRVHPHFLFNTLNSISALIREDPVRAERMVERLASLLRFSLDSIETGLVPLAMELKVVRDYLEIEKARFGNRLHYAIAAADDLGGIDVPPMSIQTLVENSVKYAVSARREGASIEVRASLGADMAVIDVVDDGPGFDRGAVQRGHGLELLESRLNAIFGEEAALEIAGGAGEMRVSLLLPLRVMAVR